jgi:DNA-directed RNA polymerase specialized sigma subunit
VKNEIKELIDYIQLKKRITLEELANEIGYTRQSLQVAKNSGGSHKLIYTLKETYKDILKDKVYTTPTISTKTANHGNNGNDQTERLIKENEALKIEVKLLKEMISTLLGKR